MKLTQRSKRWLRRVLSSGKRRPTSRRNGFVRSLQVEGLEGRALLAAVSWIAVGDGNWNTAANWSPPGVPGASDDVTISPAAAVTVTIPSGYNAAVKSLTTDGNDTLLIAGGSLTVTANSSLAGPLSMTGGSLTASGAGVTLQANGTTGVTGASLYAKAGATLSLPNLTSYTKSNDTTFQATGTSSTLNLPALATLGNMSGRWTVQALAGGTLNLSSLAVINQPNAPLTFQADGVGSQLDLSSLTSFTCQDYFASF